MLMYIAAEEAVALGCFNGIELFESSRANAVINRARFYQSLADSMQERLLPKSETDLIESIQIVLPGTWAAKMPPEYGENELKISN